MCCSSCMRFVKKHGNVWRLFGRRVEERNKPHTVCRKGDKRERGGHRRKATRQKGARTSSGSDEGPIWRRRTGLVKSKTGSWCVKSGVALHHCSFFPFLVFRLHSFNESTVFCPAFGWFALRPSGQERRVKERAVYASMEA